MVEDVGGDGNGGDICTNSCKRYIDIYMISIYYINPYTVMYICGMCGVLICIYVYVRCIPVEF